MASSDVRIVVIDDVSDVADALAMQLSLDGYQVETAYSVEKAVLCVELLQPHCVIFDIAMPGLDGHALVTMLRHRFKDQMVLVAITGSSPSEARVRETVSLVDHYFQKPVDLNALRSVLPSPQPVASFMGAGHRSQHQSEIAG